MDPTLHALAHKFRANAQDDAPDAEASAPMLTTRLRHRVGDVLVSVGQRLQANTPDGHAHPCDDGDICIEATG